VGSPAERIRATACAIDVWSAGRAEDARARVEAFRDASVAAQELAKSTAVAYASAMRELVEEMGATAAARELGISRNRVYQITRHH